MREYWNHNTAYHPTILRAARRTPGPALDIGCGDGLLVARLAAAGTHVTGLEPDARALDAARVRTQGMPNVELVLGGLPLGGPPRRAHVADVPATENPTGVGDARAVLARQYALVTMVAVLHHVDTRAGLRAARALVAPGGHLVVVGLTINATPWDWLLSGLSVPAVRLMDALRRCAEPAVRIVPPHESFDDVRAAAKEVLPGARVRRGLYYRYVLRWTAPAAGSTAG